MTAKTLILCGRTGVGKDTIANLIRKYQPNSRTLSLAAPLKEFAELLFAFTQEQLYGPSHCRNAPDPRSVIEVWSAARRRLPALGPAWLSEILPPPATHGYDTIAEVKALGNWFVTEQLHSVRAGQLIPRRILQTLGTDLGRDCFGQDTWVNCANRRAESYGSGLTVITDGRFPNEAEATLSKGGAAWLIESGSPGASTDAHASETMLDTIPRERFNFMIVNPKDGDFQRLDRQVAFGLSQLT